MSEKHPELDREKPSSNLETRVESGKESTPKLERTEQAKPKEDAERDARKEVEHLRESAESEQPEELMSEERNEEQASRITKEDKKRAYNHTLKHVQSRLGKSSRGFSRIIHNPVIERASESMEKTVARPSAVLGGALFASFGLAIMSYFARRNGFALSGSELIVFISAGWLLGLLSEFIWRKLIKRT